MLKRQWLTFMLAATAVAGDLTPIREFGARGVGDLQITSRCVPGMPWTVAGEHGALFGRQNGKFEAWQWPVKLLSDFHMRAEVADYPVPIDVNALAAQIVVRPSETVITYSHAAFTIRQRMFAARSAERPKAATAVAFEIESIRPLELTFSFTPDMLPMWPAPNHGRPSGEWKAAGGSGYYVLHTDDPMFSGFVVMPRTRPGIQVPYQEHPQTYPLELKLSFDPKKDTGLVFPLVTALTSGNAPDQQVEEALAAVTQTYTKTLDYYQHFFDRRLSIETPDRKLNEAYRWAAVAIDQAQVRYHDETGLVAGYYESADSARPGYAWFFGRDTLWSSYAINSYGDFGLTRRALDFLLKRQREDGKIMHEYSQSADALDWKQTPYFYASADSTPLLVMAIWDYVKASGDVGYLQAHWDAVRKAYEFIRAHTADDGIYSNAEGTGWVESWPQGMPKEEIYLAAMDQQAATAVSHLAALMKQQKLSNSAKSKADEIGQKIEREYYAASDKFYAFSRNPDGSLDHTASIYPAVAWWDGTLSLSQAGPMLTRWASSEFSADWGTRDISEKTPFYDPISYHQGSIWPLFTGWVALAEYRAGRPLSGYAHLKQNADLNWAQDLGSVTELLSGRFFQPLGRSSSHQLWSSAMIISPLMRGLFGLEWEALEHTLRLKPHLPADWDGAQLHGLPIGNSLVNLTYKRAGTQMNVTVETKSGEPICLALQDSQPKACDTTRAAAKTISYALPAVEVALPAELPGPGSETAQLKAMSENHGANQVTFEFEAQGGTSYELRARLNRAGVSVSGGRLSGSKLQIQFPAGAGYQKQTVVFHW